ARLRPWVAHTHWKDSRTESRKTGDPSTAAAEERARGLMSGHRAANYVLFGEGEFPAGKCLTLLKDAGYAGWFSLEWEKAWHPELEPPETALPQFPAKLRDLWGRASA